MCECKHYPKEMHGSLPHPPLFRRKRGVVKPETRAGPHDRRNGKAWGEDGTDEMVRNEVRGRGGEGGLRPAVERENRREEQQRRRRWKGQCQCRGRQGGRHSRPIIIIARHNSAGLSTSPGTDWAIEPPRPGAGRDRRGRGRGEGRKRGRTEGGLPASKRKRGEKRKV